MRYYGHEIPSASGVPCMCPLDTYIHKHIIYEPEKSRVAAVVPLVSSFVGIVAVYLVVGLIVRCATVVNEAAKCKWCAIYRLDT